MKKLARKDELKNAGTGIDLVTKHGEGGKKITGCPELVKSSQEYRDV